SPSITGGVCVRPTRTVFWPGSVSAWPCAGKVPAAAKQSSAPQSARLDDINRRPPQTGSHHSSYEAGVECGVVTTGGLSTRRHTDRLAVKMPCLHDRSKGLLGDSIMAKTGWIMTALLLL